MANYPSDVAFTPTVKAIQEAKGSRRGYHAMEQRGGWETTVTPELEAFLSGLDMFYLGTANADGQPYIQYRGGPAGFLRVVNDKTLAFAEFGGNRQYITLGNLRDNPKAFLFLMDYENRRRVKVWGTARVVEGDERLNAELAEPSYPAEVERAIVFEIEAWDVNCPQHIHRRIPESRIAALQAEIEQLKASAKPDLSAESDPDRTAQPPTLTEHKVERSYERHHRDGIDPEEDPSALPVAATTPAQQSLGHESPRSLPPGGAEQSPAG